MKFLKLFSKKEPEPELEEELEEDNDILSSVTYSVDQDGEMYIDITIDSFDDHAITRFAELLVTISTMKCHLTTMEMIKVNFTEEGQTEQLKNLLALVVANHATVLGKELSDFGGTETEEPCIKPSDML